LRARVPPDFRGKKDVPAIERADRVGARIPSARAIFSFDSALNNTNQGLCMFDSNARLILCNDRYIEMCRLSRAVVKRFQSRLFVALLPAVVSIR
jgi:PAS domain-containing protein